jgi:hypothetical protein
MGIRSATKRRTFVAETSFWLLLAQFKTTSYHEVEGEKDQGILCKFDSISDCYSYLFAG